MVKSHEADIVTDTRRRYHMVELHEVDIITKSHEGDIITKPHEGNITWWNYSKAIP
jgi:hypothetical protein